MYSDGQNSPIVKPDLKIIVENDENDENNVFEAHKLLLSLVSPRFKEMFENDHEDDVVTPRNKRKKLDSAYDSPAGENETEEDYSEESKENHDENNVLKSSYENDVVKVLGTSRDAIKVMLKFIYLGKENIDFVPCVKISDILKLKQIFEFIYVANHFEIFEMKEHCENLLISSVVLTEENLFNVYELVASVEVSNASLAKTLGDMCRAFVTENVDDHGHVFLQKLMSCPFYNQKHFNELFKKCDVMRKPDGKIFKGSKDNESDVKKEEKEVVMDPSNKSCMLM